MTFTEEEAKAKWCPFARLVLDVQDFPSGNRFYGGSFSEKLRCIGSGCMAWRWGNTIDDERRGYCGLAGKP